MSQLTRNLDYAPARVEGGIGTQTWGLLVDAYRDLHSKKLFWITLVLSLLVALLFLFIGIDERGVTVFGKLFPGAWNTKNIPRDSFYRFLFTGIAISWWLGFFAAILGLISVGGVFPDMLTGGSIDLYLSKPISRLRLFLSKYLFALLFVAMQVAAFSLASFVVMGIRGNAWEPGIFLAVPLVVLFFSYLYCVCVLIGIITRSTLAAILLTVLVWGAIAAVNGADALVLAFKIAAEQRVQAQQRLVSGNEKIIMSINQAPPERRAALKDYEFQRDLQKEKLRQAQDDSTQLRFWHNLIVAVKTPLPKTGETIDLMSRWLVDPDPFFQASEESYARRQARLAERAAPTTRRNADSLDQYLETPEAERRITRELQNRSQAWIIGTSLAFEAFVLALAAWIFCRRDY